jgi:hypothetical protein
MSDYVQITSFTPKDALSPGNPAKRIKGADLDPELSAISTAVASKYDSADLASNADAAAGSSTLKLMTPATVLHEIQNATFTLSATATLPAISGTNLTGLLKVASNLSDLASAATARTNLGVTATGADTAYAFRANNLSDLASAASARSNLGLGALATLSTVNNGEWSGTDLAVANGGTGASTAADARTNLGLVIGTDVLAPAGSGTGLSGVLKTANNLSDVTAATARTNLGVTATGADTTYNARASNLSDVANAATARGNLGAAASATTVSVSGTGLSGGGDLSANRTITIDQTAMTTRNITGKTGIAKTLSTSAPSGGADGDIWYRYT